MADFRGHDNRMSVPQFGAWNGKSKGQTNYSMVFSQARANRKRFKGERIEPHSLGNERELLKQQQHNHNGTLAAVHDNGMSVPQFGAWDGKTSNHTNYSVVLSQAHTNRKSQKSELVVPHSLGNEKELLEQQQHIHAGATPAGMHDKQMSVPQFGAWDGKTKDQTNYSVVFSQARGHRKNHKSELLAPRSLGNESELLEQQQHSYDGADAGMHDNPMSAPQFGAWDGKMKDQTNYSVVFSQARANRKKDKSELVAPRSLGNERELLEQQQQHNDNGADSGMHDNRMSIPQFGEWDSKTKDQTNYSVVFSQACANRKNHKSELVAARSLGNERELFEQRQQHNDNSADTGMHDNRMSVAQFGACNGKSKDQSNYPVLLSQACAIGKIHKSELVAPHSLGDERELLEQQKHNDNSANASVHNHLISLPQFGAWNGKTKDQTNYSVVFSQARANREKYKNKLIAPHSLGSERELQQQQQHFHDSYPDTHAGMRNHEQKKMRRKESPSCFSCFYF